LNNVLRKYSLEETFASRSNVTRLSTRAHEIRGKSVGVAAGWIIHNVEARIVVTLLYRISYGYSLAKPYFLYPASWLLPSFVPTCLVFFLSGLYTEKPHKKSFNAIGSIRAIENFQVFFLVFHGK